MLYRYAEFSAAVVGINETFPHEQMNRLLAMLQEEMEGLLLRLASQFSGRKEQLLFLINNYDLVMSILMERTKVFIDKKTNTIYLPCIEM